jgi:hypothetical protein
MSLGRLAVGALAVVLALSGLLAMTNVGGGDDHSVEAIALEHDEGRREDGDDAVAAVDDDNEGDGDGTRGNDGTSGGDNTGDGDATRGNDGTSGGDNTGDGDRTRGNDGTSGGDNSYVDGDNSYVGGGGGDSGGGSSG